MLYFSLETLNISIKLVRMDGSNETAKQKDII
jgi:hypothetical protein